MPELPEVETIRRGLKDCIVKQRIKTIQVFCEKSFIGEPELAIDATIVGIRRFGKALVLDLDNDYSLMIHLRMTGQLIWWDFSFQKEKNAISNSKSAVSDLEIEYIPSFAGGHPSDNFVSKLPNKQTRVLLQLERGILFFNDQRKFGFIKVVKTSEIENDAFIKKLAKEPWAMTVSELYEKLQKHKKSCIKAVILDQTVICGLGNIYADEALYASKILPMRKAGSLSEREVDDLLESARRVMEKSIESGGSTMRNYVKADGTRGDYLDLFAQVFNKTGKPCARCGEKIKKIKVAGRGTHYCPRCQK